MNRSGAIGTPHYCGSSPIFFTIAAYFAISERMNRPAYSGVLTAIELPCFAIASVTSGEANAAATAALIRLTSASGSFAGPMTANQPSTM